MKAQNARSLSGILATFVSMSALAGTATLPFVFLAWPITYMSSMIVLFIGTEIRSYFNNRKTASWKS